jgi:hypothetical protein
MNQEQGSGNAAQPSQKTEEKLNVFEEFVE